MASETRGALSCRGLKMILKRRKAAGGFRRTASAAQSLSWFFFFLFHCITPLQPSQIDNLPTIAPCQIASSSSHGAPPRHGVGSGGSHHLIHLTKPLRHDLRVGE